MILPALKRAADFTLREVLVLECLHTSTSPLTVIDIEEMTDEHVSESHADKLLHGLVDHGLVIRKQRVERNRGGRPPFIWSLTPKGRSITNKIFNP